MFTFLSSFKKEKIIVIKPNPYQEVGAKFLIWGLVSRVWLETDYGIRNSISLDLIDINGQTISGSSISVGEPKSKYWFSKFKKRFYFSKVFQFFGPSVGFIEESQGRMTIKLSGENEKNQSIYIPIIVKQFEPEGGANPEIIKRHGKISEIIKQYEKDLKTYYEELDKIEEIRLRKNAISKTEQMNLYARDLELVGNLFVVLEKDKGFNKNYPFIKEDLEEKRLKEKYKDAIEWQGPLLGVVAGRMDGFEFRIFSNDHGKHFHVMHKGRGINARFSFPEIKLINYKYTKVSINNKEKNKIEAYFKNSDNFKRLENEFLRREQG